MDGLQDWPKAGTHSDVAARQCPPKMIKWLQSLDSKLLSIINIIAEAGGGVWIVGGAPRDVMLETDVTDIDLAVDLNPQKMLALFP
ncbi:MAG: hypothetical protein HOB52_07360, partial [Euryarchaeota archaeon]|nr:hypothetical protein [Euryarchaeota archaeon]